MFIHTTYIYEPLFVRTMGTSLPLAPVLPFTVFSNKIKENSNIRYKNEIVEEVDVGWDVIQG